MTRKDYKLIAEILRDNKPVIEVDGISVWNYWDDLVFEIAFALAEKNPRFDRKKFYKACGKGDFNV